MTSGALRFTLLTIFVGLLAGAGYLVYQHESESRLAVLEGRTVEDSLIAASRLLLEIKSAQPGYVAAGQGEDFWLGRVDALLAPTREALGQLEGRLQSAEGRAALRSALETLHDFEQMDRRARSYVRSGQRLLASDLVFTDGIEKIAITLAGLEKARGAERAAVDQRVQEARRAQLVALAGASGGCLLLALVLTPLPGGSRRADAARVEQETPGLHLQAPAEPQPPLPAPAPESRTSGPPELAGPAVDLPGVAALCMDLARVCDRQALPAALERAAGILDASGIVIWVADPEGRELVPVIAHGYSPSVLARLGRIERDAENVTAAAFRTGLVQTMNSDDVSHGAIAAPLVGADGPVGVMAAEVLHHVERQDATRAAAAIIAAQLAALMGPPQVRTQNTHEAARA